MGNAATDPFTASTTAAPSTARLIFQGAPPGLVNGQQCLDMRHIMANSLGSPVMDSASVVVVAKTVLTPTQIKTMYTTPVTVVAAPGAGKILVPAGPVGFFYTYGTAAYTSGGVIKIEYDGDTTNILGTTLAANQLGASDTYNWIAPLAATQFAAFVNKSWVITNATGVFAGSTSTGTLTVLTPYYVMAA